MSTFLLELKTEFKPFLGWMISLLLIVYFGLIKFEGFLIPGFDINSLMEQFPKIILAVFGMVGIDILSIEGFFTIIGYLNLLFMSVYALRLGNNLIQRELYDKTYEFLFSKPISRRKVLFNKFLAHGFYLTLGVVLLSVVAMISVNNLPIEVNIDGLIRRYAWITLLISLVFYWLSASLSTVIANSRIAMIFSTSLYFVFFFLAVLYDWLDHVSFIKYLTPFKFFEANELIQNDVNLGIVTYTCVLIVILSYTTFRVFQRKDLIA